MCTLIVVSFGGVIAGFFTLYVGGMFMFRKCQEVDRDRHADQTS